MSPLFISEKSLSFEKWTSSWVEDTSSPKLFSPQSPNFILAVNPIGCFPGSDGFTLFIFVEMSAKYPSE